MRILLAIFILPLLAIAQYEGRLQKVALFENSVRRDPLKNPNGQYTEPAVAGTAKVRYGLGNCTGFFIDNINKKFLFATAQHCVHYDVKTSCRPDGIKIKTTAGGHEGFCENIVYADENSDFFIFEVRFETPEAVLKDIRFLRLARYFPYAQLPLNLIGYPMDTERKGRLTVSDKCNVLADFKNAKDYLTKEENSTIIANNNKAKPVVQNQIPEEIEKQKKQAAFEAQRRDTILKFATKRHHNCSVWGGNSGGPLVLAGSIDVVGMPLSFYRSLTKKFPVYSGVPFEISQSIIQKTQRVFDDYKVIYSQEPSIKPKEQAL